MIDLSERYSRQLKIEGWDQEKVKNAKCIIIGAGALGSVVAVNLAQAGVGSLTIVDMDTIEFSNLNRQLLFQESDVGKFKAEITKEKLTKINSEITINTIVSKIQDLGIKIVDKDFSVQRVVLIDALDNFESRRWLNALAVNSETILISGGMYGFFGNVQNIIVNELPCLECQPLIPEQELQKACTPPGEFRKKDGEELDIIDDTDTYFPALGSVSSVIGGIMAQEAIKIILGMNYLKEYLFIDLASNTFLKLPLSIKEDCIVCSQKYKINGIPISFDERETIKDLKNRLQILFDISKENMELIFNLKTLTSDSTLINELFSEKKTVIIYLTSSDLSTPKKLALKKKSSKTKVKKKKATKKKKRTTKKKRKTTKKRKTPKKKKKKKKKEKKKK